MKSHNLWWQARCSYPCWGHPGGATLPTLPEHQAGKPKCGHWHPTMHITWSPPKASRPSAAQVKQPGRRPARRGIPLLSLPRGTISGNTEALRGRGLGHEQQVNAFSHLLCRARAGQDVREHRRVLVARQRRVAAAALVALLDARLPDPPSVSESRWPVQGMNTRLCQSGV